MDKAGFETLVKTVTDAIAGRELDESLMADLNAQFPPGGETFQAIEAACRTGIAEGWMCAQEHGGIKFGRVSKPGDELSGFSIDVVEMTPCKGPHHRHPNGEIDMIMPVDGDAKFDGHGKGWLVYGPDSAHHPTVTDGRAVILYLLPGGAIEFTKS